MRWTIIAELDIHAQPDKVGGEIDSVMERLRKVGLVAYVTEIKAIKHDENADLEEV